MLKINNIYGHGYGQTEIEHLRAWGFRVRHPVSRFAGSQLLRFVDFATGPSLEFIEVESEREYFDFLPKGMVPYCPGINLLIPPSSSRDIGEFRQIYHDWGANPRHVNYDGSDEPNKPGWNFLNFDLPVVRDTFVYLTQLDDPQPDRKTDTDHPNSAKQVRGLVFKLDEKDLAKLARLAGAEMIAGTIDLVGVQVWSSKALQSDHILPEKRFPLAVVVIKADSLDFFVDKKDVTIIEFESLPAAYIKTPDLSWDMLITT